MALVLALEAERLPHLAYIVDAGAPMTMPEIVAVARAVLPDARIELMPGADAVSGRADGVRLQPDRQGSRLAGAL